MAFNELFYCIGLFIAMLFYAWRVGLNLSVTSTLLGLLCVFHGPAYLYYTRIWGPETAFFETILLADPTHDVVSILDLALGLLFIFVCAGILFADLSFGRGYCSTKQAVERWSQSEVYISSKVLARVWVGSILIVPVIFIPFVLFDGQLSHVIGYFTSAADEQSKIAMRREFGGSSIYLYNLLMGNMFPFISFCLLVLVLNTRKQFYMIAFVFIAFMILAKAATLSKAPPAIYVLQLFIVGVMCRSLRLSVWTLVKIILAAMLCFAVMAVVANPEIDGQEGVFQFLFYRVFMIVNEGLVEYFAAIPSVIPHSWGAQISWVATLFQKEPQLPTFWLVGEVHRGVLGSTTTVMFLGDAWADFAWYGVCIVSFIVGVMVRWLDIELIVKRGKTPESVAGLAVGHYGVFIALSTAFQTALVTGGFLFIAPLVILMAGLTPWRQKQLNRL